MATRRTCANSRDVEAALGMQVGTRSALSGAGEVLLVVGLVEDATPLNSPRSHATGAQGARHIATWKRVVVAGAPAATGRHFV